MQSVIGALRVNLGIDSAQFDKGLKDAQSGLAQAGKKMQALGATLSARVTAPLVGLGAGLATGVGVLSKNLAELDNQSKLAGLSVEQFQKLAYASESVGLQQEKLSDILKDVNDKVGDFMASGGGELKDFFDNIAPKVGLTADAFKDLNSAEALQLYVSSLEKAGVSQAEMTFYLESIADEASALAPLLADNGAELGRLSEKAERFGIVSEDSVDSAKAFNQGVRDLQAAVASLGRSLIESGILEALAQIVTKIAEWVTKLRDVNPDIVKFGAIFAGLAAAIGPVLIALGLLATGVAAIGAPIVAAVAGVAAMTAAIVAFWPEINAAKDAVIAFGKDALEYIKGLPAEIIAAFKDLPAQMLEIGSNVIQGLKDGIASKVSSVKETISGAATGLIDKAKSVFDTNSPSRVFLKIGGDVMDGLRIGLENGTGSVTDTMSGLSTDLRGQFSSLFSDVLTDGKSFSDGLSDIFKGIGNQLISTGVSSLFGGIRIPGFAKGTNFAPGGLAMVGEKGPELVNLPRGSQVIPNDKLSGGGMTLNIDARGADQAAVTRLENTLRQFQRDFQPNVVNAMRSAGNQGMTRKVVMR